MRTLRRELEGLRQDERERARRIDLLTYQVQEIRAGKLQDGETEELEIERRRLTNAEQLAQLASEATQLLQDSDGEQMAVLDAVGNIEQALSRLARIDPSLASQAEQLEQATALLDDLARELGRYRDEIEFNPKRLTQVEERLHLIHSLQRKYGDTIPDVLAYGERAAAELRDDHSRGRAHRGAGKRGDGAPGAVGSPGRDAFSGETGCRRAHGSLH